VPSGAPCELHVVATKLGALFIGLLIAAVRGQDDERLFESRARFVES